MWCQAYTSRTTPQQKSVVPNIVWVLVIAGHVSIHPVRYVMRLRHKLACWPLSVVHFNGKRQQLSMSSGVLWMPAKTRLNELVSDTSPVKAGGVEGQVGPDFLEGTVQAVVDALY
jgi:hypothetical protein